MNWHLIHTKPRQEKLALLNLQQQGYECYLPTFSVEKVHQSAVTVVAEPLFPRYLFIRLDQGKSAKSWSPIRSTKGVNRLVSFGNEPAKIDEQLVNILRTQENVAQPQRLFSSGERVLIEEGPFTGIEALYQIADGERRAMVLVEMLNKPVYMRVNCSHLRKIG